MANKVWDAGVDTDLAVAGNWTSDTLPVNGDLIIFDETGSKPTAGFEAFGGTKATATLTIAVQPSDGDEVNPGGKVYTFKTTLADTDGFVLIGASATTARDNLIAAIELAAGAGTTYAGSMTAPLTLDDRFVNAVASGGNDMICTLTYFGIAGNSRGVSETMSGAGNQWDDSNYTGGVDFGGDLLITPTCNYEIGTAANPFTFSSTSLIHAGSKTLYHRIGGGLVTNVVIRSQATGLAAVLGGAIALPIARLHYYRYMAFNRGRVDVGPNGSANPDTTGGTEVYIDRRNGLHDVDATFKRNFAATTYLQRSGVGRCESGATLRTMDIVDGELYYAGTATVLALRTWGNCVVEYNTTAGCNLMRIMEGLVDMTRSGGKKTIGILQRSIRGRLKYIPLQVTIITELDTIAGD